jgi:cell division protein FtsL
MDATESALRKIVHNNPIVREVDEVRQREMWQWVWIGLVLVHVLLVSAWLQFAVLVQHGYDMETLQRARAAEAETARLLHLDIERLSSPKRIEEFATTRLQMVAPGVNAIVLPRIVAPERPPSSVVAAR